GLRLQQDGLRRGDRLAAVRDRPAADAGPLRLRPQARVLRRRRPMTKAAATTQLSYSARSPIARTHRKFLAKASLTMFAVIIISAYLMPLLYMVTTSFEQPSQISTPGAPPWPAT